MVAIAQAERIETQTAPSFLFVTFSFAEKEKVSLPTKEDIVFFRLIFPNGRTMINQNRARAHRWRDPISKFAVNCTQLIIRSFVADRM